MIWFSGGHGFPYHLIFLRRDIRWFRCTKVEDDGTVDTSRVISQVLIDQTANIFGERDSKFGSAYSKSAMQLRIKGYLSAYHHNVTIILLH